MQVLPSQSESFAELLRGTISGEVLVDPYQCALYGTDASIYQIRPLAVVLPRDAADVRQIHLAASQLGLSVIPRGSGTSLSGQVVGEGVVVDFSKYMNSILEFDPQTQVVRVEPGVVLDDLNRRAAPHALQFGPDVATSNRANLGGMIGNNSAGARSIVGGRTVDHVIALDVVLDDGSEAVFQPLTEDEWRHRMLGPSREAELYRTVDRLVATHREEIERRFPRTQRRVSGYNLDEFVPACAEGRPTPVYVEHAREALARRYPGADRNLAKLIVGAEGSLATVTSATLQLVPLPAHRGVVVLEFESLATAIDAVGTIIASQPSAVEMFDQMILELAGRSLEYRNYLDFVTGQPESLIIAEFSGDSLSDVQRKFGRTARPAPRTARLDAHAAGVGRRNARSHLGLPQGRAAAVDGCARSAKADRLRRRHRRAAGPHARVRGAVPHDPR